MVDALVFKEWLFGEQLFMNPRVFLWALVVGRCSMGPCALYDIYLVRMGV